MTSSPIATSVPPLSLLQITLIVHDLASVADDFERELGLRVAFRDPGVGLWGLENAVLPMGSTFIELLSPLRPDTPGGRHLARQGGDGGYMVILQVEELESWRPRVAEAGVRIAWEGETRDTEHGANWAGFHLHPGDTGGMMISLDCPDPPDSWAGAGPSWRDYVVQDVVDGLVGITLESADPGRLARRWSQTLGRTLVASESSECAAPETTRESRADGSFTLALDQGRVDFARAKDAESEGLCRVSLHASDRAKAGTELLLGGVRFELT
jgi:hypothetical protein